MSQLNSVGLVVSSVPNRASVIALFAPLFDRVIFRSTAERPQILGFDALATVVT